jgi:hypothetical protein
VLAELEGDSSLASLRLTLTRDLGFTNYELAMLTGFCAGHTTEPAKYNEPPYMDQLDDLADIAALLIRSGEMSPRQAAAWFRVRNRDLDWVRPLRALWSQGFLPVHRAAEATCDAQVPPKQVDPR